MNVESEVRLSTPSKSRIAARGTSPWCFGSHDLKSTSTSSGPNIVCVLPEPVCPYAISVAL